MPTNSGNIILNTYNINHTLSGTCAGYINQLSVSGGTSPYSILWSGMTTYSANTFAIYNLCENTYLATLTDISGNTGSTSFVVSGLTKPTIETKLSDNSCIADTNKTCTLEVVSAKTLSEYYRYELRKDGSLIDTYYGTSADTSHSFMGLYNAMYTVTLVENTPTIDNVEYTEGCTGFDYYSGPSYSGWSIPTLFNKWTNFVPWAKHSIGFTAGWGPAWASHRYVDSGLALDGSILYDDPKVWFYTGASVNRLTDNGTWYLGVYSTAMKEGGNVGPVVGNLATDIGKFYFNTHINKFVMRWPTHPPFTTLGWLTINPTVNYGRGGNPIASNCTGATNGISNRDLTSNDRTVSSAGTIVLASNIIGGANRKFYSMQNNSQSSGMISACPYNSYEWELTLNSVSGDNDTIAVVLHSFKDTLGQYGPVGVRHNLSLNMATSRGRVIISNNSQSSAYGFNKTTQLITRNCNGGCITASAGDYGQSTILANSGTTCAIPGGVNWNTLEGIRLRITRNNSKFKIEFTDPLDGSIGDARPYNAVYDINFDILNSLTWSGNSGSAPSYSDNNSLLKFNTPGRVGFWQGSQPGTSWYHMKFKSNLSGPSTTTTITATTATTLNTLTSRNCQTYLHCNNGVPTVRPNIKVQMQTYPQPTISNVGLATPSTRLTTIEGNLPALPVYNITTQKTTNVTFYFGGDNSEMLFGNTYPKFRVYPYIFETEEVATAPDYEAIIDTLPSITQSKTGNKVFVGVTPLHLSGLSTDTSWEFIVRPSFLTKDKLSYGENWIDSAIYPPSKKINYKTDYYMVIVKNPQIPTLNLNTFTTAAYTPTLRIVNELVTLAPTGDTVTLSNPSPYSSWTHTYTFDSRPTSQPAVSANGVMLTNGASGGTHDGQAGRSGDYLWAPEARTVRFHRQTVKNGDKIQYMFDSAGGSYTQFLTIPGTVSTSSESTMFQSDGFYFINLDKQSSGGVGIALNGALLYNNKDYKKVGENRIQLLKDTSTYQSNDAIALFYRTIYDIISYINIKNPVIPVTYFKTTNLIEKIVVRLFNGNGDKIQETIKELSIDTIGLINANFTLKTPKPNTYYYDVLIRREYPLINGETITTESQTDRVSFVISDDVFYS
tara:strand:- start:8941 stop:12288 length:3348 start_codon:yes stop_codon:yes gene_type:complete